MKTALMILTLAAGAFVVIGCDNVVTEPDIDISEYVTLGISWGDPTIAFPKETGSYNSHTSLHYDSYGRVKGYELTCGFPSSGNYYILHVSITRDYVGRTTSFTCTVTARIDGRMVEGALSYP